MLYNEYSTMFKENDLGDLQFEHIEFLKQGGQLGGDGGLLGLDP